MVGKDATTGTYSIMPRVSMLEKDNLTVSLSYPQTIELEIPVEKATLQNLSSEASQNSSDVILIFLRDFARYGSIGVALILIGYLIYRKIKQRKPK
jgi:hypothetical protein